MILPQSLGISPDLGKNQKGLKFSGNLGNFPRSGENLTSNNRFILNNFFSSCLSGQKNELIYSPIDYACPWIIIAYLEIVFLPKNWVKNLLLPQIWGIFPVLKIAIAPDLGKFSRSKCHLTVVCMCAILLHLPLGVFSSHHLYSSSQKWVFTSRNPDFLDLLSSNLMSSFGDVILP